LLELRRGDTNPIQIICQRPRIDPATGKQAVDARGMTLFDPVDLTGALVTLTARNRRKQIVVALDSNPGSGLGGIVFQAPLSSGLATATIQPAVTETLPTPYFLKYDVQLIEANGTKTTVAAGQAVVREDQSRG
jgi:hypothetical protein